MKATKGQTVFMPDKTWRGHWWLPSEPEEKIPGLLIVKDDGSCLLQLVGGLDMPLSSAGDRYPVVYGNAEDELITLLDSFTTRRDGLGGRPRLYQDIHVGETLIGAHIATDASAFRSAIVTIENLTSWLAFDSSLDRTSDMSMSSAIARKPAERSCVVDGWKFTAHALLQPFQVEAQRKRITLLGEISSYIVVEPPTPVIADEFHGPVLELMDLITLASGEASGRMRLTLVHVDDQIFSEVDGTTFSLPRTVESYGARVHKARPDDLAANGWDFLFTCKDLSFEEVLPRWLRLRRLAPDACNVFFGLRYSRPAYTEVRLLLTAIAAETLHANLYGDETELSDADFAEIRCAVLGALPDPEQQRWVKARLRNSPSFRERLISLAAKPDPTAVRKVLPDPGEWARALRDSRNGLAHTGNEQNDADIFRLERVTTRVIALVCMSEMGLSAEVQQRAARQTMSFDN